MPKCTFLRYKCNFFRNICPFQSTFVGIFRIMVLSFYGGFFMFNLIEEKDKYLTACKSLKGLSNLTLKAYQKCQTQDCLYQSLLSVYGNRRYYCFQSVSQNHYQIQRAYQTSTHNTTELYSRYASLHLQTTFYRLH